MKIKKPEKTEKPLVVKTFRPKIKVHTIEKTPLYIVGIGGSAGALEAYEQFFKNMPDATGIAFVLIPHLDPTHKGIMPEIIQRLTKMKVNRVEDGMKIMPDNIYVIPSNKDMSILHGKLLLLEPSAPRGMRMPIDFFFRHLAEDQQERAVCIILSGMGSDGTLGLKTIKEKLGMAMVQAPDTAKYDTMPKNAVDTGLADYVLPVEDMPYKLLSYIHHAVRVPKVKPVVEAKVPGTLPKILILLRDKTGHDFSQYKKNMLYRRIERRMSVHQINTISNYVRFLQENPHELELLFKELLIGVTSFFRDPEAFSMLKKRAIMTLLKNKTKDNIFRVWVPGCSTGEEAYSIAMLIRECLGKIKLKDGCKVQIFATDIDSEAIDKARTGTYPANITADVSPERLERFFIKTDQYYQVKKDIREMVVFAPQNIIMDPPFSKVDLISCRNLLIYLTSELQKKLLPLFYYALNQDGVLFLGSSETVGGFSELFSVIDTRTKIFRRKELVATALPALELPLTFVSHIESKVKGLERAVEIKANVPELIQRIVLENLSPPVAIINLNGDIVYFTGRTGKYLEPPVGKANLNIYGMAREGLRFELAGAIRKAVKDKTSVVIKGLHIGINGGEQVINLTVKPFTEPEALSGLLMIVFEDVQSTEKDKEDSKGKRIFHRAELETMEKELKYTKEYLQTVIEEMETSQEELKATNEELQSTNEELQSTNEELTTSKEELQSLNEEMVTVNAELQSKVDELSQANNDMKNLLNSTEIATIFLDNNMNINRFTSPAVKIMNLIPSDVGRPVTHIVSNLIYEDLLIDSKDVLRTLVSKEMTLQSKDGKWYSVRIMPYRTVDNIIDGIVITFIDITRQKLAEKNLEEAKQELSVNLDALARLQTIISREVDKYNISAALDEIIETAIIIAGANKGSIQLIDEQSGDLKIAASRGFEKTFPGLWNSTVKGKGAFGAALEHRESLIIEDITQSSVFKDKPELNVLLEAGVQAVYLIPVISRSDKALGMLSVHYSSPRKPDERSIKLLYLLVRLTAEIIERTG